MKPALYYQPDAYTISGPKLMGRHAAGVSFLRGFFAHAQLDELWLLVDRPDDARKFAEEAKQAGRNEPVKALGIPSLPRLAEAGLLYCADPTIGRLAWHRAAFGHGSWSLCGITHTTSSAAAMDALTDLITAPVQPWDAVICTSEAVKSNVTAVFDAQVEYMKARFGIARTILPTLPVIPLGIHCDDFVRGDAERTTARQALDIADDAIVVLYVGRLSFTAKAHPLAMYQALEQAAEETGKQVVLIECGWHAMDQVARAYAQAAQAACPGVRVITLDGREAPARDKAWGAADIFCSLSDNIQETFGLTPIEAMAAGLPVVVSDWNGYKESVRDGVDGFRIPTLMPRAGLAGDLALRHGAGILNYDAYCGHAAMMTAVDVAAARDAFVRLFASPDLRARMGAAGREHARRDYDWAAIIPRYQDLWRELDAHRRRDAKDLPSLRHGWPARLDPFHAFASYPTRTLNEDTVFAATDDDPAAAMARLTKLQGLELVSDIKIGPSTEETEAVLAALANGPRRAGDLIGALPRERRPIVLRGLGYLAKLGIVRTVS